PASPPRAGFFRLPFEPFAPLPPPPPPPPPLRSAPAAAAAPSAAAICADSPSRSAAVASAAVLPPNIRTAPPTKATAPGKRSAFCSAGVGTAGKLRVDVSVPSATNRCGSGEAGPEPEARSLKPGYHGLARVCRLDCSQSTSG